MVAPRYEVVCRLGGGGMADLHLARLVGLGGFERLLVVKRLAPHLASNPEATQALLDEARIAATLSHANIVQVHDVEVANGQVSIAMEFLHGHDVRELVARTKVPLDQGVAICLAVCAALHHAHERAGSDGRALEIVHRDVSPHNVFVTYDGVVKLVDFGIARATSRANQTEQGVIKGKPGYMSPEQVRGLQVDRRTDVWAAALLLYEITTGTQPFRDGGMFDIFRAVVDEDPPPPSSRVDGYPPELEAIVMRGLARDQTARYPTAAAMQVELEAFARSRSLDLSAFGITAMMERVFRSQLASWRRSQREGRSLADHLQASARCAPGGMPLDGDGDGDSDSASAKALTKKESSKNRKRADVMPESSASSLEVGSSQDLGRRPRRVVFAVAAPIVVAAILVFAWAIRDPGPAEEPVRADRAPTADQAPTITPPPTPRPTPAAVSRPEPVAVDITPTPVVKPKKPVSRSSEQTARREPAIRKVTPLATTTPPATTVPATAVPAVPTTTAPATVSSPPRPTRPIDDDALQAPTLTGSATRSRP